MTSTTQAPSPAAFATVTLTAAGAGSLSVDGAVRPVRGTDLDDARDRVRKLVAVRAATLGEPVTMTCTDPAGSWTVQVRPDGTVTAADSTAAPPDDSRADEPKAPTASASSPSTTVTGPVQRLDSPMRSDPPPVGDASSRPVARRSHDGSEEDEQVIPSALEDRREIVTHPLTRAELRAQARQASLLEAITNEAPAATGLRGALNQLGLHLAPSQRERSARDDVAAVAQHWPGPRTIAVVNGKGGAAKTPSTIMLAATFARYGGAGVVAWDNNSTRGTLGWRTQQGPHDKTVEDMLPQVDYLLSPQAQAAQMAAFTHHQRLDRYDVLRSRPEALSTSQPSDAVSIDAIHSVLTKYYRLVFIDSGNDESTEQWRAMVARADAIVVPTITRPEHAESARLLLDELARADEHSAALAENALVVVSQSSRNEPAPRELVGLFKEMARTAVGVPYDPAMAGRPLILDSLAAPTRRAWLSVGAALADALT